jgi:hypothetical protein
MLDCAGCIGGSGDLHRDYILLTGVVEVHTHCDTAVVHLEESKREQRCVS